MEVHQVSQRRACSALNVDRSMVRYQSRRADDTDLRNAIKRVSRERRRFGYRRIHVMVEREGYRVNHKKLRRIYREEKLQVRRRGGRKRALGTRKPMVLPDGPNQRWSLDFRIGRLHGWSPFPHFGGGERFHPRELGSDCRHIPVRPARHAGAERDHRRAWSARYHSLGQRHRVHQHGHPEVGTGNRDRLTLHRAGQADPERIHRKLQWQAA